MDIFTFYVEVRGRRNAAYFDSIFSGVLYFRRHNYQIVHVSFVFKLVLGPGK